MINSKQRAYLRSIANTIDTILMVGKGGITEQVIKQGDDALTAREIIKGKVLETSELNSRQTADVLSKELNADVVQVIGSKFVLYRPNPDEPVIVLPKAKKK
ncbi:MAG: YhbY family RNA-binding protein [Oscillospiraceae bacterium]|nr:YhbY family RNA-binding protein [Oscillospiraceae bacterium]